MDAKGVAGVVAAARAVYAAGKEPEELDEAVGHLKGAKGVLDALSARLSLGEGRLDMAQEIRFLDRTVEQLAMLSMSLDGMKRRLR
jgi:hypothetical protein